MRIGASDRPRRRNLRFSFSLVLVVLVPVFLFIAWGVYRIGCSEPAGTQFPNEAAAKLESLKAEDEALKKRTEHLESDAVAATKAIESLQAAMQQERRRSDEVVMGLFGGRFSHDHSRLSFISKVGLSDENAEVLRTLRGVRFLSVSSKMTDGILAQVAELRELQELELQDCSNVTDAGVAACGVLPELESLHMSSCAMIGDAGVAKLSQLPKLRTIRLKGATKVTGVGLAELTNLRSLSLEGSGITDATAASLKPLRKIEYLDLSGCQVSEKALPVAFDTDSPLAISTLILSGTNLETIDFGPKPSVFAGLTALQLTKCVKLKAGTLSQLVSLRALKSLSLAECPVVDTAVVKSLCDLPKLEALDLSETKVADVDVENLAATKLVELRLSKTEIADACKFLPKLKQTLKRLDLSDCAKLTATAPIFLKEIQSLEELNLDGVAVDGSWLDALKDLKNLKELSLRRLSKPLDPKSLEDFQKDRPGTRVLE